MIRRSAGETTFDVFNLLFILIFSVAVIIPILHIIAGSLSDGTSYAHGKVTLWPSGFTFDNYGYVMDSASFWHALGMTTKVVVIGTAVNLILTVLTAYPLSKMWLKGRNKFLMFIVFTLIFQAPMIPSYLVVKNLELINSMWALIIPGALSAFYMLLCITFFRAVPEELFEAAKVDGMGEGGILVRILMPLSKPILFTLLLFYSVGHWNNYQGPLLYINDRSMQTLQMYLYRLISQGNSADLLGSVTAETAITIQPEVLEMATIMLATLPIVIVYPFIQKHFIAGATLGSIKE